MVWVEHRREFEAKRTPNETVEEAAKAVLKQVEYDKLDWVVSVMSSDDGTVFVIAPTHDEWAPHRVSQKMRIEHAAKPFEAVFLARFL